MNRKQSLTTLLLVVVAANVGVVGGIQLTKQPDETLRSATKDAVLSTVTKVSRQIGVKIEHSEPNSGKNVESEDASQAAARDALLRKMFLHKGDSFFTQSRWGAQPVPYELRDFQLLGPHELSITTADRNSGIDKKINYEISVRAYRVFDGENGWTDWTPENPPRLEGITMVRKDGKWATISDPTRLYALR